MVAGNWKMNNLVGESVTLASAIRDGSRNVEGGDIVVAPPFTALASVYGAIKDSPVKLAAQDLFYEDKGAYTGEVAPTMIKDAGCTFVILGHSERRKYFGEKDETVNLKVKKALATGLRPILCVGETEEERDKGVTEFVVGIQVRKGLSGIPSLEHLVIAYEPVWAIGTGKTATPMEAEEVHRFIRSLLGEMYGSEAKDVRILYGGSVTADNMGDLIAMEDIDGALVGGASLKSESFLGIIQNAAGSRKC
jgi:triosephosphate isomerase